MSSPTDSEIQFFDLPSAREVNKLQSLRNAPTKGALKTWKDIAKIFERDVEGPGPVRQLLNERPEVYQKEGLSGVLREAFPYESPFEKVANPWIEQNFPTRDEPLERILQDVGSTLAVPITGGMKPAEFGLRALAGAGLGEVAHEAGFGPVGKALAALPAWMLSPRLSKEVIAPKGQEALFDRLRDFGLTEEQITRATQSRRKTSALGWLSGKGTRAQEAIRDTQEALGGIYNSIRNNPTARTPIDRNVVMGLFDKLTPIARDIPVAQRKLIAEDVKELISSPITPDSLMGFYKKVNTMFQGKGELLQPLKSGITDVIYSVSPDLGESFEIFNNLYSHMAHLRGRLAPGLSDDLINVSEAIAISKGILSGETIGIKQALLGIGARKLAQEALISPRLQSLGQKFLRTARQGSLQETIKLSKELISEIKDEEKKVSLPETIDLGD